MLIYFKSHFYSAKTPPSCNPSRKPSKFEITKNVIIARTITILQIIILFVFFFIIL